MKHSIFSAALIFAMTFAGSQVCADDSVISLLRFEAGNVPAVEIPDVSAPVIIEEKKALPADVYRLSGEELFQYLHKYTVPMKHINNYTDAKSYMYGIADNQGCDGIEHGILTFYSQVCAPGNSRRGDDYKENGDENKDGVIDKYINAEHIWPQSFFGKQLPMVSDLHHLQSTFGTPNNRRSNFKFGYVSQADARYSTASGTRGTGGRYEPCDAVKGNVARSVLYFVTRYYDKDIRQKVDYRSFWTDNINMFLQWNRQDPPDAREIERNNRIELFQGNRNPYVDDYTLADRVGAEVFASH